VADTETPRTAADVIAVHLDRSWRHGQHLDCGAPLPPGGRDFRAAHVTDMLAAAGLLATAEHDRGGAVQALREVAETLDGADAQHELSRTLPDGSHWSDESVYDAVANSGAITDWLGARADRLAAGEGS